MKNLVAVGLILFSLTLVGFRIAKGIEFKQNVSGYLKRAADANTIELANKQLKTAIGYLESNNLTSGYTSILYQTPDEDIGFWYENLKASQEELENLNSDSPLEKTNVLMKLRETLIDTGEKSKVTVPAGLPVYPHNKFWAAIMSLAALAGIAGFGFFGQQIQEWEEAKKRKNALKE